MSADLERARRRGVNALIARIAQDIEGLGGDAGYATRDLRVLVAAVRDEALREAAAKMRQVGWPMPVGEQVPTEVYAAWLDRRAEGEG